MYIRNSNVSHKMSKPCDCFMYINQTMKNHTIELEFIEVRTLSDDGIHYQTLSFSQFIAILQWYNYVYIQECYIREFLKKIFSFHMDSELYVGRGFVLDWKDRENLLRWTHIAYVHLLKKMNIRYRLKVNISFGF